MGLGLVGCALGLVLAVTLPAVADAPRSDVSIVRLEITST